MSFFRKVRENFRDTKRDEFCAHLRSLGMDAEMASRGRREEKLGGGSLGLIDISKGPIRWVNVRRLGPGQDGNAGYYAEFGVPDPKVTADFPKVRIRSVKVKTSWFFGKVVDIEWKGEDFGLGIVGRLRNDRSLKNLATEKKYDNVVITARPEEECWTISYGVWASTLGGNHSLPSAKMWNSYEVVARHLLD